MDYSKSLGISDEFEVVGVFWPPNDPENKFAAFLSRKGVRTEIVSAPELGKIEMAEYVAIFNGEMPPAPSVLHGVTSQGKCSLIGLQARTPPYWSGVDTGIRSKKFIVSACIFGVHISGDEENVVTGAVIRYSGISQWLRTPPNVHFGEGRLTYVFAPSESAFLDVSSISLKTRILVKAYQNLQDRPFGKSSFQSRVDIHVESSEPRSLNWYWKQAGRIENFLSLILGTSVVINWLEPQCGPYTGRLNRAINRLREKTDRRAWVECSREDFSRALMFWLSMPAEFEELESLIYGTIRHGRLFVETEFLSLAQAIESLHRVFNGSSERPAVLDEAISKVEDFAKTVSADPDVVREISDSVRLIGEWSFQKRVSSLFSTLKPENVEGLIGDSTDFEKRLRHTRNYRTHPGIKKGGKVITDINDFFPFNEKLKAIIRLILLKRLGFTEETSYGPCKYQASKWS